MRPGVRLEQAEDCCGAGGETGRRGTARSVLRATEGCPEMAWPNAGRSAAGQQQRTGTGKKMDSMMERLDKHVERLDQSKRHISDIEDGQLTMSSSQAKMNKELMGLQAKVDDLEAISRRNNLRIVGVVESTDIDSMEGYIERLLVQLLVRDTFSSLFVVERAHNLR
ncbi:hypothetical protein NDU88_004423 [Pleurodeles waltl]|uniref:Uncharacterized protein n=1 Tax=Pleurodeles waltl TaxID=8319 RepID=A0AAV7W4X9_PLEWA|nr:hypothetical protein NDU88_004423 [Pleurodeles waltl]